MIGYKLRDVTFRTRVRDDNIGGDNPYRWENKTTADYFAGKRVILFSLPGLLPQPVQHTNYRILKNWPTNLRQKVLMKYIVFR